MKKVTKVLAVISVVVSIVIAFSASVILLSKYVVSRILKDITADLDSKNRNDVFFNFQKENQSCTDNIKDTSKEKSFEPVYSTGYGNIAGINSG